MGVGAFIVIVWILLSISRRSEKSNTDKMPSAGDEFASGLIRGLFLCLCLIVLGAFTKGSIPSDLGTPIIYGILATVIYAATCLLLFRKPEHKSINQNLGSSIGYFFSCFIGFIICYGLFYSALQDVVGALSDDNETFGIELCFLYLWDAVIPVGENDFSLPPLSPSPANNYGMWVIYGYMVAVQISIALFIVRIVRR